MPYADSEKLRKAQEKINPLQAFRIYLCVRFPTLHVAELVLEIVRH